MDSMMAFKPGANNMQHVSFNSLLIEQASLTVLVWRRNNRGIAMYYTFTEERIARKVVLCSKVNLIDTLLERLTQDVH